MSHSDEEIKEVYRLFYLVKGHIDCSPNTALSSANSYFKRLWYAGSNGAPLYEKEEEFEIEWEKKKEDILKKFVDLKL